MIAVVTHDSFEDELVTCNDVFLAYVIYLGKDADALTNVHRIIIFMISLVSTSFYSPQFVRHNQ